MKFRVHSVYIANAKRLKLDTEIYQPEAPGRLPFVMLFHGFTGYKEDPALVDISKRLAKKGIISVRFTASGFGGSEGILKNDYRFSNNKKDASSVFEYVSRLPFVDADRFGVYGHSLGGKLAVIIAKTIATKALCVMSAPVSFIGTAYEALLSEWKSVGYFEKVSGRDGKTIRVPYEYVQDMDQPEFDVLSAATSITKPHALVIAGTADTEVPWMETKKIYDVLGCKKTWVLHDGLLHKYGKQLEMLSKVNEPIATFFRGVV